MVRFGMNIGRKRKTGILSHNIQEAPGWQILTSYDTDFGVPYIFKD